MLRSAPLEMEAPVQVLIIDDDCEFSVSLGTALAARGWIVQHQPPEETLKLTSLPQGDLVMWDIEGAPGLGQHLVQLIGDDVKRSLIAMASRSERRWMRRASSGAPFINKGQDVEIAVARITQFLTERQASQEAKAEAQIHAEEERKNGPSSEMEFLARVSHELRTPLNAIIGFSELIMSERHSFDPTQHRVFAADIHASGHHLLGVINDLLSFATAESGKLTLNESECELAEVFASINRLLGQRVRDAGVQLNFSSSGEISLWCDRPKLKQMLLNLITNALGATPSGGRIDIDVASSETGVAIAIRDTGTGIAPADLQRVLKPFVQVDNSLSRGHEGIGLGLPLVKIMMELHGGEMQLQSQLRKGTAVTLYFPPERRTPSGAQVEAAGENR